MAIETNRILLDIEAIAGFNESTPDLGYSRPTFSAGWRVAGEYVTTQARAAGCDVRIDAAGNVHARHASVGWDEKVWLSGSHIDSVPTGGKFDGVTGVVCALEVLRGGPVPMELIIFAEEEGTTFGLGMIGSRLWVDPAEGAHVAAFKNCDGQTFFEAGLDHGVSREQLKQDRLDPSKYLGFIEIHIEQGPAMWAEHVPLAVVTAIAGRRQYKVSFSGTANHAGSTPMRYRADPLVAAARVITGVDAIAREFGPSTVATVGRVECQPNAVNVIPGTVQFTIDLRSSDASILAVCNERLERLVAQSGAAEFNFKMTENQPPMDMDARLCERLYQSVGSRTVSGALHDAAILAPHLPTAMLFVASRDGISHNPAEFSRIEDLATAAHILEELVRSV